MKRWFLFPLIALPLASACSSAPVANPAFEDPRETAAIDGALRARGKDIRACYASVPGNVENHASGTIEIRFAISAADNRVIGAAIGRATLEEPDLASCLLDVVVSTRFPKVRSAPNAQDTQVAYTFAFPWTGSPAAGVAK